ncbi:unnamed protein product [Bursaphelenchus okinawaensis]|uniref:Uncharacterized protein n=1 Tax=Bursaphelenchus okinawaensis TaxID=465554 RepID=A0A811KCH1_9BILA|nr:unnamed protein product [Bursaphelenchus okinawaensis]CAG9100918.1 unnamed protein product [Bursaphelenchus okinawaensis]
MFQTHLSGWRIYLLVIVFVLLAQLSSSVPLLMNVLTRRNNANGPRDDESMLDWFSKRSIDYCGCNMGCFYQSASQCASCCALGL